MCCASCLWWEVRGSDVGFLQRKAALPAGPPCSISSPQPGSFSWRGGISMWQARGRERVGECESKRERKMCVCICLCVLVAQRSPTLLDRDPTEFILTSLDSGDICSTAEFSAVNWWDNLGKKINKSSWEQQVFFYTRRLCRLCRPKLDPFHQLQFNILLTSEEEIVWTPTQRSSGVKEWEGLATTNLALKIFFCTLPQTSFCKTALLHTNIYNTVSENCPAL